MPKRFTDTDKWKKPFIRGLEGPYKLLWFYILDDCDHAGIWQVDFEVARIRIGEQVNFESALKLFGTRIHVISKFKWFIPDFITFQYGELSEKNRLHISVLNILSKYELGPYKPLPRGQGYIQGQGKGKGQEQGTLKIEIHDQIFTDGIFLETLGMTHKGKDLKQAFEECWVHHVNSKSPPGSLQEWKQKLNTWLINTKTNGTRNGTKTDIRRADATIESGADFGQL